MQQVAPIDQYIATRLHRFGYEVMVGTFRQPSPEWHRHRGFEIVFLHSRVARVHYGKWRARLLPCDAVLGPADIPHGAQGIFDRTVIHFDPNLVEPNRIGMIDDVAKTRIGYRYTLSADAARRLVWVAEELRHLRERDRRQTVRSLLSLVLSDVEASLEHAAIDRPDVLVQDVVAYMETHLGETENLAALADQFGCSRSYMSALFYEHLKCPPGEYWLRLRLEHACQLLQTDAPVQAVAHAVGFHSCRGLQHAFRRQYGMSPSAYRQLVRPVSKESTGI